MSQIEQIKAEIEQQLKDSKKRLGNIEKAGMTAPNEEQLQIHLKGILAKLDTLQEQPVCEGLEDVADTLAEEHGFVKKPDFKPAKYSWSAVRDVFIEGVIAGAQWQKEQMMKGAIDVTLNYTHQITLEGGEGFGKKGEHIKFIIVKGD